MREKNKDNGKGKFEAMVNSIFLTLGASNHTDKERQKEDYYATEPKAVELLLNEEKFAHNVWECACGGGDMVKVLESRGYSVRKSDIIDRMGGVEIQDFLSMEVTDWDGDIITNPPYKYALDFVYKALEIIPDGRKVAMFLKLQFLEGRARKELFLRFPPKVVYVASGRLLCAKNGEFEKMIDGGGSAVAYAWFVWEKGYKGETVVKWIN